MDKGKRRTYLKVACGAALIIVGLFAQRLAESASSALTDVVATASRPKSSISPAKVIATVNQQPIYEKDVDAAIPADSFVDNWDEIRATLLDRAIHRLEVSQFLQKENTAASSSEVEAAIGKLRANPPSMGCPCHRYDSLDAYLLANNYTIDEYRKDTANDVAMEKYYGRLFDETYPTPESRATRIAELRPKLADDHAVVWNLFFNTNPAMGGSNDPNLRENARKHAQLAWQRLQSGESFESVAKSMSEDQVSRDAGGYCGIVSTRTYGDAFANKLAKTAPGKLTGPFEGVYGFHIAKWAPVPDSELLKVVRDDFEQEQAPEIMTKIAEKALVAKL